MSTAVVPAKQAVANTPAAPQVPQPASTPFDRLDGELAPFAKRVNEILNAASANGVPPSLPKCIEALEEEGKLAAEVRSVFAQARGRLNDDDALRLKGVGNEHFTAGRHGHAIVTYTAALQACATIAATRTLLGNRSAAFMASGMKAACVLDVAAALALRDDGALRRGFAANLLDRRGRALKDIGHDVEAAADAEAAAVLKTGDADALIEVDYALPVVPSAKLDAMRRLGTYGASDVTAAYVATGAPSYADSVAWHTESVPLGTGGSETVIRRYVAMAKRVDPFDMPDGVDVATAPPAATAMRADAQLAACAWCLRRTSLLYPSRRFRERGYRCRGLFCGHECDEASWGAVGQAECGNPFVLAAPTDAVMMMRLLHRATTEEEATEASGAAWDDVPTVMRPRVVSGGALSLCHTLAGLRLLPQEPVELAAYTAVVCLAQLIGGVGSSSTTGEDLIAKAAAAATDAGAADTLRSTWALDAPNLLRMMRLVTPYLTAVSFLDRVPLSGSGPQQAEAHKTVNVPVAKAYFPLLGLFAHSCAPNCAVTWADAPYGSGARVHVRLLRRVVAGEELSIAWGGITHHTVHSSRQRILDLRKRFGFTCRCDACTTEMDQPLSPETHQWMVRAADYYQKGRRLLREGRDIPEAEAVLKQSLEILFRYVCPPPQPPMFVVPKTYDAIAQACMMRGDWAGCLDAVDRRIETLEAIEGPMSLDFVHELAKAAVLRRNKDRTDASAAALARRAAQILAVLFPPSSTLAVEKSKLSEN